MTAPHLDQAKLHALLHYDAADSGVFTWLPRASARWNTRYAGRVAGYDWKIGNQTYRCIRIFDWPFLGHRLAFLYITGNWPALGVDHRDGNGLNNRWANLREATKQQNAANTGIPRTNTSGFKGVSPCKNGKWRATIRIDGRQRWLGRFDTKEAAYTAYCRAAADRHGEFERTA